MRSLTRAEEERLSRQVDTMRSAMADAPGLQKIGVLLGMLTGVVAAIAVVVVIKANTAPALETTQIAAGSVVSTQ